MVALGRRKLVFQIQCFSRSSGSKIKSAKGCRHYGNSKIKCSRRLLPQPLHGSYSRMWRILLISLSTLIMLRPDVRILLILRHFDSLVHPNHTLIRLAAREKVNQKTKNKRKNVDVVLQPPSWLSLKFISDGFFVTHHGSRTLWYLIILIAQRHLHNFNVSFQLTQSSPLQGTKNRHSFIYETSLYI